MKLTKKQKNAIFKAFAERLVLDGHGCPFCKHFTARGEVNHCKFCEQFSRCDISDKEGRAWYWAEVEAALENTTKTK